MCHKLHCLVALLVCVFAADALRADEAPAARAYFDSLTRLTDHVESQLPAIGRAADLAAARYIDGGELGVRGGAGLAWELADRPGGLMRYHGSEGRRDNRDVILFAFHLPPRARKTPDHLKSINAQIAEAVRLKDAGCVVIGIASGQMWSGIREDEGDLWNRMHAACNVLLDNGARETSGETQTETVANALMAWTIQCEFFASCVRRGRVPVMRKSLDTDFRHRRFRRYTGMRYHSAMDVASPEPGELGRAYLDGVRLVLRDIGTASWPALAATAHRASATIESGGRVFVRASTTYLAHHHADQLDGSLSGKLIALSHDGSDPSLPAPGDNDFTIAFGYCDPPGSPAWGEPELLRGAGRGVSWVISGYLSEPRRDLRRRELLIDQQWTEGDAIVKAPGYDIRIGSASGVASEAIYWAIIAQIKADLDN